MRIQDIPSPKKSELFFKKIQSFVVLPNSRGDGLLDSDIMEYRKLCREALKPLIQERHLKFYNLIACRTLISNRDSYFKEIDKIKVFQRAKSVYIPVVMMVKFKDGTEYVTNYDLTKVWKNKIE